MVNVDQAIIARLKAQGQNFEILADCSNALALREGKSVDMHDVLAAMKIFSDAKKGLEASETAMRQIFGTSDVEEVAKSIGKVNEIDNEYCRKSAEKFSTEVRSKVYEQMFTQVKDGSRW